MFLPSTSQMSQLPCPQTHKSNGKPREIMLVPLGHVATLKSLNKREHIQEPSLIPCLPCHPASQMLQLSCPQTHKSNGKPREIYACSPGTWGSLEVIEQRMGMMDSAPWKCSFWDDNLWNFFCATFRSSISKGILMFHTCNRTPKQMGWERAWKKARYLPTHKLKQKLELLGITDQHMLQWICSQVLCTHPSENQGPYRVADCHHLFQNLPEPKIAVEVTSKHNCLSLTCQFSCWRAEQTFGIDSHGATQGKPSPSEE